MSKKKLPTEGILNELEGASSFFYSKPSDSPPPTFIFKAEAPSPEPTAAPEAPATKAETLTVSQPMKILDKKSKNDEPVNKIKNNTKSSKPASKLASTPASIQVDKTPGTVESIRRSVKQMGKEVVFIRVTSEEKHSLGSIVYSFNEIYREEGRKTSENEIGRIGLNYLLEDYRENGSNSILARVLAALNA